MSNKTMGSKLADSLRQMRGEKPADAMAPPPAPTEKKMAPQPELPRQRAAGTSAYAQQSDQSPAPSLDHPWRNLHPARIWPD